MTQFKFLKATLAGNVCAIALMGAAIARNFDIPGGDLESALNAYSNQSGVSLIVSADEIKGIRTKGVMGDLSADVALTRILSGTGFTVHRHASGKIGIARETMSDDAPQINIAAAPTSVSSGAALETVTVTSSKIGGDVQNIPISITALSQEQLTQTQTAGGPDLVKQVPNLTFSKTNFTGYNIEIRGIGTQAISVTTDPAVAVAFNDIPFIRNHFFEQEFYDVSQVEVLRGPQGTLYGRNATAGVVNLVSAKPTDQYEAMGSVDIGNYNNRRLEAMLNIPVVGDKLDLRMAGEWTKRDGYAFNEETGHSIDGRDLWSGRMSVLFHPVESLTANLIWEHFDENDDRARSTKQLCKRDPGPAVVNGPAGPQIPSVSNFGSGWLSQGCLPGSLYAPSAFGTPNAAAIPFVAAAEYFIDQSFTDSYIDKGKDPYESVTQSPNLRVINSQLDPKYRAKNDTLELNADYDFVPALVLTSQTGYNKDFLYSTEDYNRFNTAPGLFNDLVNGPSGDSTQTIVGQDGEFCDPQLGCSTKLLGEDVSQERAWQFTQELRLASNFQGPLNFSVGGNFLHYQTVEDYYVFFNLISLLSTSINESIAGLIPFDAPHIPFNPAIANACDPLPATQTLVSTSFLGFGIGCGYVDPNPLDHIDGQGHNYFRSQNPYHLNSWAGFGEVYYQATADVKFTGGLRWTDDKKNFEEIPSWALILGKGYPVLGIVNQQWQELTGRLNATWTPALDFTDQSLFYASYSRGYKGGGANPPGVIPSFIGSVALNSPSNQTHPLTFKPEFINAYEIGTKNVLLDGAMTLNASAFFYDYKSYQISEIVDRTSVNLNFDATVKGLELESAWEPFPGLRFNLSGGYQNAMLAKGSEAIDLMDRTAGHAGWMVVKPAITETSNCVLPTAAVNELLTRGGTIIGACATAYIRGLVGPDGVDPVTRAPYVPNPDPVNLPGYEGFDPTTAPNGGEGFDKNLSGNQLPNAPPFTLSAGAQYSMPLSADWAATLRADGYWQGNSFARIFNDEPYDQLHGYTNMNLALIFTNQDGWQAMAYMKNVFNTTAITGAFLNSDDTALTTNVFVTDPRLFGLRITKNW